MSKTAFTLICMACGLTAAAGVWLAKMGVVPQRDLIAIFAGAMILLLVAWLRLRALARWKRQLEDERKKIAEAGVQPIESEALRQQVAAKLESMVRTPAAQASPSPGRDPAASWRLRRRLLAAGLLFVGVGLSWLAPQQGFQVGIGAMPAGWVIGLAGALLLVGELFAGNSRAVPPPYRPPHPQPDQKSEASGPEAEGQAGQDVSLDR